MRCCAVGVPSFRLVGSIARHPWRSLAMRLVGHVLGYPGYLYSIAVELGAVPSWVILVVEVLRTQPGWIAWAMTQ